ncbi:MAG: DUF1080 domain-containing protein [Bryobacteraceae bacterium]|nr:DUF1080 domain-containing protein [Bryobacteraceae bacterium]
MRCLWLFAFAAALGAEEIPLFNGKNLDGWEFLGRNGPAKPGFRVRDGLLETIPGKGMLWYTREKIGNATLRIVYRMSNIEGNSGVFIRIPEKPPSEAYAIHKGIEVQLDDSEDDFHATGTLYSMTKAKARASKPSGEWNTMEIKLEGLRTIVKVNGVEVTDYDGVAPVPERTKSYEPERGQRPEYGYIGLQNHDMSAVVAFKEVTLIR